MSFKKRRIIFWSFVFIFIVGAAFAVLYSSGWRLNIKTFIFEKTGGIYIKSQPQDVLITIDRKSQKSKKGLIFYKGTLFTDFSHKKYNIEVAKDDFLGWSKKLDVEPLLITQATHIILLPENPTSSDVFNFPKNFDKIFYGPSYNNFLVKFNFEKEASLFVFNLKNNSFKLIYQATEKEWEKIAAARGNFKVKWSPNEKMAMLGDYVVSVAGENSGLLDVKKEFYDLLTRKVGARKSGTAQVKEIFWHPFLENAFLVETSYPSRLFDSGKTAFSTSTQKLSDSSSEKTVMYLLNLGKKELSEFLDLTESRSLALNGSGIYWLDSSGGMFYFNLISNSVSSLYSTTTPTSSAEKFISAPDLIISDNQDFIAVVEKSDNSLHILDMTKNDFYKPMHSGVKKAIFSPDNKKLAVLENDSSLGKLGTSLKIIYLTDFYDDFIKKRGDIDLLGKYPDIKDFFWHSDSNHLWIKTADALKLVEIDARDKINSMDFRGIDSGADVFLKDNNIYNVNLRGVRQYKIFE